MAKWPPHLMINQSNVQFVGKKGLCLIDHGLLAPIANRSGRKNQVAAKLETTRPAEALIIATAQTCARVSEIRADGKGKIKHRAGQGSSVRNGIASRQGTFRQLHKEFHCRVHIDRAIKQRPRDHRREVCSLPAGQTLTEFNGSSATKHGFNKLRRSAGTERSNC